MAVRRTFQSKDPAEKLSLPFNFTADLGSETISSATATATVEAGTDGNPSAVLNGSTVIVGGIVYVPVQAGIALVDYAISCAATTSGGRVLVLAGLLPVRTA